MKILTVVGAKRDSIVDAATRSVGRTIADTDELYGGGKASIRIAAHLAAGANQS